MTHPSDIAGLSERLRSHVNDRGGCFKDDEGNIVIPNGAWSMMLDAATALDSLSARVKELERNPPLLDARSISGVDELVRSLESRATRAEQQRDEAYERLKALVEADALAGVRKLVAGWTGEDRPEGPFNERHPDRLGATLPKTNCGAIYQLDDAMVAARDLIHRLASGPEGGEKP